MHHVPKANWSYEAGAVSFCLYELLVQGIEFCYFDFFVKGWVGLCDPDLLLQPCDALLQSLDHRSASIFTFASSASWPMRPAAAAA